MSLKYLNPWFLFTVFYSNLVMAIKPASRINGSNRFVRFGFVYEKYRNLHLPTLTELSRIKFEERAKKFLAPLFQERIANLTPERIGKYVLETKNAYKQGRFATRYSFEREVQDLRTIFNWWRDNIDFQYQNPVKTFHKSLSTITEMPDKNRRISPEETFRFLSQLKQPFRDFFELQLYCSARVGEIAGLQVKNVNLEKRVLLIKEVITWVRGKATIKNLPKNGKAREVHLNDTMVEILKRRLADVPPGCPFVFHNATDRIGWGLRYNRLNQLANRAWKQAGLSEKFSGSHFMRYAGAQLARSVTGSLDATAAVTGHISRSMCEHYAPTDSNALNQSSLVLMEKRMKQISV